MNHKVIKQQDVPDQSPETHRMCVCDTYDAWRALTLLLGYTIERVSAEQDEHGDDVIVRDAKDEFGRVTGAYVMYANPNKRSMGDVLVPVHLVTPVTAESVTLDTQWQTGSLTEIISD